MDDRNSRYDRYEKRRKNTKLMTIIGIVGGLLALFLLAMIILPFGDENAQGPAEQEEQGMNETENETSIDNDTSTGEDDSSKSENGSTDSTNENSDDETTDENHSSQTEGSTEESDDENVTETIQKDWEPVGTEQEGEHVTQFDTTTQDWEEMEEAVHLGAGLNPDNSIIWHIGNGGSPQKAIGTITNKAQTEVYRVYIQWIDERGWKPTKVEVLKENDKKELYQDNDENNQEDEDQ